MSSPNFSRFDYFLHASSIWLNWSYLDVHWEEAQEEEDQKTKRITLFLAYGAGCIGHLVTIISKVVEFALFIVISLGVALYTGYLSLRSYLEKTPDKKSSWEEKVRVYKYRLYESLLITTGSVGAFLIDGLGILAPPLAYKMHNCMQKTLILPALNKMGLIMPSDEEKHRLGEYIPKVLG